MSRGSVAHDPLGTRKPKTPQRAFAYVYAVKGECRLNPLDLESATRIAEQYIRRLSTAVPLVLLSRNTIECKFGWVFFYGPVDPAIVVAGNAPLIVDRRDGTVHETGTAFPTEKYIESYERTGRTYPFAVAEYVVVLDGWEPGLRKILLTKLIQQGARKSLIDAKRCTDEVLTGRTVALTFTTATDADSFCSDATLLGVRGRRETRFK